jgi:hypothetical protein
MIKKLVKGAKAAKKFSGRNKGKDPKDLSKKDKALVTVAKTLGAGKANRAVQTKKMMDAVSSANPGSSVSESEYRTAVSKLKDNREKNAKAYRKQN